VSCLVRRRKGTSLKSFSGRLFDVVQAIAVTLWVGTLWSTGALVAPALFRMISDRTLAGDIAGYLFGMTAFIGLACAGCLLTVRLIQDRTDVLRQPLFWLVLSMVVLVCVSQFGIQPVLASLREQAYPQQVMQSASAGSFAIWHAAAGILYLVQSALGLVLVAVVVRTHPR
jgi:hypothetical protein